ncbi:MAG: hypothetical protein EBR82_28990 [Caulobacteraceae bacterium]|nr:hypothetical protein [Caulobacteraceae bacterium]
MNPPNDPPAQTSSLGSPRLWLLVAMGALALSNWTGGRCGAGLKINQNSSCSLVASRYIAFMTTNQLPNVTITQIIRNDVGIYVDATCGKISAFVFITDYEVRVICQNASNKVWRGAGRAFQTAAEAVAAYKKLQMKAIILAVDALNA